MIAIALVATGCHCRPTGGGANGSTCASCPPSSLPPPPPACGKPGGHVQPLIGTDPIDMPHNGLSPTALVDQAELIKKLKDTTLAAGALSTGWDALLSRPGAADLMEYVVSCALDPCATVAIPAAPALASWRARLPDGFPGALGLCSSGDLHDDTCWQRVSSCVVARVNAVDARVTISMRGDGMMTLRPKVPVETEFRENHGTPIRSFARCDQMCLWGDPLRRNCDWQPRFVGQCVYGPKDAAAGNHVRLSLAGGGRIRVCDGLYGCDDVDPAPGAGATTAPVFSHGQLVTFPTYYAGHLLGQALGTTVEFACPANGPLIDHDHTRTGYYAVMVGAGDPTATHGPTDDVTLASPPVDPSFDRYPATEAQVFTYREGGFYGSLGPHQTPTGEQGELYACASSVWTDAAAVSEDRLCAETTPHCFATQAGQCDRPPMPPPPGASSLCTPLEGPTAQNPYGVCKATPPAATAYGKPYTVFLSHPCDLFASDAQCEELLERTTCEGAARRGASRPVGRGAGLPVKSCADHPIADRDQQPR